MLALLATADKCERARSWLQQKLWGSRDTVQAQASLRRELSNLKLLLSASGDWLISNHRSVRIDLSLVDIDILDSAALSANTSEFLEGIDIPGEDDFEDWLREMRSFYAQRPRRETSTIRTIAPPIDLPPSRATDGELLSVIAVLPTRGLFTREDDLPLVVGLTRLLVDGLVRLRWLPVIAPESSHAEQLANCGTEEVAMRLRSRYVLEPEIVRSGATTMLNFVLLEMPVRKVLWSATERVNGDISILDLETIIFRAVNMLANSVDRSEQVRSIVMQNLPPDLTNLLWRVRYHLQKFTREDMATAEALLGKASAMAVGNSELVMLRAHHAIWSHWLQRAPMKDWQHLLPLARAAMKADPADARGPLFLGVLETWARNTPSAIRHLERSCELNPCFPTALTHLGAAHYLNGEPQKSIEPLERALSLSPMDPFRFFAVGELGTVRLMLGDYDAVLALSREIQLTHPNYVLAHVLEINALVEMGRTDDAREVYERLLLHKPHLYEGMLTWIPFRESKWIERLRFGVDHISMPRRMTAMG